MNGPERKAQPYTFVDEDGNERTAWDVMQKSPPGAQWGDYYLIARYSDQSAAEFHARTGRKPGGYS